MTKLLSDYKNKLKVAHQRMIYIEDVLKRVPKIEEEFYLVDAKSS